MSVGELVRRLVVPRSRTFILLRLQLLELGPGHTVEDEVSALASLGFDLSHLLLLVRLQLRHKDPVLVRRHASTLTFGTLSLRVLLAGLFL